MSFTRPYVTAHFIDFQLGDAHGHGLSIALRPIDEFTRDQIETPLGVKIKERPGLKALRNLSGFLCFEDLEPNEYTLLVDPDPAIVDWFYVKPPQGDWTDKFEFPVDVVANTVSSFDLHLVPRPSSYPFPPTATLVRGIVTQGSPNGVANAVVRATYEEVDPEDPTQQVLRTVEALTDGNGEYVLFFKRLPLVREGDQDLTADLVAVKGPIQSQTAKEVIKEGKTLRANPLDLPL
jgi:hypothetical protein